MRTISSLLFLVLCPLVLSGDVDVLVTSGSPLDWLGDLSRPTISRERTHPGGSFDRSTVVEESPRIFSSDVYRVAKITTRDLIGEIPWTVRRNVPTDSLYPPTITDDVLWVGMAVMLRRLLHPVLMSQAEAEEYLINLGQPAHLVISMAKNEPALKELCKAVSTRVAALPKQPPVPPKGKTAHENMMYRLTWEDLTCAWPFSFDGKFAGRISLLGNEAFPYVLAASRSRHLLLQRNAAVVLGRYASASAADRLREMLEESKDAVVRARALDGLARLRDKASVPALIELSGKGGKSNLPLSAVRALGLIGDPKAMPAVVRFLDKARRDYDRVVPALTAFARLAGSDTGKFQEGLSKVRSNFPDPKIQGKYYPSVPDEKGTAKIVVEQLRMLARARFGDKKSAREILDLTDKGREKNDVPNYRRMGRTGITRLWKPQAIPLLLETLATLKKGDARLVDIAKDDREDISVRVKALAELAKVNARDWADDLKSMVTFQEEYSVAVSALHILSTFSPEEAVEAAEKILTGYKTILPPANKALVGWAIRFLARRKLADPAGIIRVLEHEIILAERAGKPKPKPKIPTKRYGADLQFESPTSFVPELVLVVGRVNPPFGREALRDVIANGKMKGRAEALIALATIRDPKDLPVLLDALREEDPWIRFMASRGLKYMLGRHLDCDWMYGSVEVRAKAAATFQEWVEEQK